MTLRQSLFNRKAKGGRATNDEVNSEQPVGARQNITETLMEKLSGGVMINLVLGGNSLVEIPSDLNVNLNINVSGELVVNEVIQVIPPPPGPAVRAIIRIGERMSTGTINVDTQGEFVKLEWLDDHNDVTAAPADAAPVVTSSSPEVTLTQNATDPHQFDLSFGAASTGTVITATGLGSAPDGSAIADASTPPFDVDPGAAVGARITMGTATP